MIRAPARDRDKGYVARNGSHYAAFVIACRPGNYLERVFSGSRGYVLEVS